MATGFSCATAAARPLKPTFPRPALLRQALLGAMLSLAACAVPRPEATAVPPPPKDALAFRDAVDRLTVALFARAKLDTDAATGRTLVIDPLIDRATGNQSAATQSMEERMTEVVRQRFQGIQPQAFTAASLDARPLILVGSITPVAAPGVIPPTTAPTQTYRIWASLADLRTNRIISHETAWVRADGVDMTPTPFFRDSPSWIADRSQAAYIKTCAGNPGDPVDPAYLNGLRAAAAVADGVKAYDAGRYGDALMLYARAQGQPSGDQLRVYNGLYLANAALGRSAAAEQAFGTLVEYGLERGKLAVKFVFRPNSTEFWPDRAVSGPYPMWLRQIASRAEAAPSCLQLVGHTSPTGPAPLNQALSLSRASYVRNALVTRSPPLANRTGTEGHGSAEPLVGSGRDDATDVLDRRVEFEVRPCLQAGMTPPGRG
jgi:outer membrane protein OmpA-like peptidoglycan-associated protein